jgi:hypothetical protein
MRIGQFEINLLREVGERLQIVEMMASRLHERRPLPAKLTGRTAQNRNFRPNWICRIGAARLVIWPGP